MTPKFIYHEFRIVMRARDYIRELAASGRHILTTADAVDAIGGKPDAVRAQLRRLGEQGHLAQPVRSFRVIVPPEYLRLGCLPAEQFIDPLMEFLGEPYYVGLLSAAERHGAAHHRPQITQVVVRKNRAPVSCGVVRVVFIARADLGQMPVSRLNTPRGAVSYSTPEVTGLELVGYPGHAGGLDNVATVLVELAEQMRRDSLRNVAQRCPVSWAQRLGYLLELVGQQSLAQALRPIVRDRARSYTPLRRAAATAGGQRVREWKLIVNAAVEVDA